MPSERRGLHPCRISVSSAINAVIVLEAVVFDCLNATEHEKNLRIVSVNFAFPKIGRPGNTVKRNRIMLEAGECVTRGLK
jgi:hypothetical protein